MMEAMRRQFGFKGFLMTWGLIMIYWSNYDSMSAIYLTKNQVYHLRTKHIDVRFHLVWEILMRVTSSCKRSCEGESWRHTYQGCPSIHIARSYSISFKLLELIWMNYGWLDPLGRGYIGNRIGATRWSRHGAMLRLAHILEIFTEVEICGESVKSC